MAESPYWTDCGELYEIGMDYRTARTNCFHLQFIKPSFRLVIDLTSVINMDKKRRGGEGWV